MGRTVIARVDPTVGVVEPFGERPCLLLTAADPPERITIQLSLLMMDFRVADPPEPIAHIEPPARGYSAAVPAARGVRHRIAKRLPVGM